MRYFFCIKMAHPAPHLKAQAEGRRLFIGGLNYETTDQSLQAYLSTRLDSLLSVFWASKPIFCLFRWPIEEVRVKRFPDGNSRGFGWVCYILDMVENGLYLTFVSSLEILGLPLSTLCQPWRIVSTLVPIGLMESRCNIIQLN